MDKEMKSKIVDVVRKMDDLMQGIPSNEDALIGGDMNEQIISERREYERIHGRYSFRRET